MKRNNFRTASAALLILLVSLSGLAVNMPLPPNEATHSITVRDLKRHLTFLASDELGGRYTLSEGNRIAGRYLASQLESYGYRGGAKDGSFFQKVPLSIRTLKPAESGVALRVGDQTMEFKYGSDFMMEKPVAANLNGDLVFVGRSNATQPSAALTVSGKIVVTPSGGMLSIGSDVPDDDVALSLINLGAIGVILVPSNQAMQLWNRLSNYFDNEGQPSLPPRTGPNGQSAPVIYAGPSLIKAIAGALKKDENYLRSASTAMNSPEPIAASASIKTSVSVMPSGPAQNVIGILEGSDPRLKEEYVVYSAHYDHLAAGPRGEVYNGADDDGSGTVAVLEIAEALAVGTRPLRSTLIIFHTAEEMGLLGSEFNTDYEPVVPMEKLVANFNIDMIGRARAAGNNDPRDRELTDGESLYVIGADKLSTELNRISEQTNAETARMRFDYTYNDDRHPQRFYYRSDHYNYAKHGVPIIFYFTGVHRDYHRTTDDVDKIDFSRIERISRMVLATGWRVANLDHKLVVDKKPR